MGALLSVGIKIIRFLLVIFFVQFFVFNTFYSVKFLFGNSELTWVSFIISISMIAKIILSIMIFVYYKKVKVLNVVHSLSFVSMIDVLIPAILFVILFYRKSMKVIVELLSFLSLNGRKTKQIDEFTNEIKIIMISNPLSELQKRILIFLGIYIISVLTLVVLLRKKINKE